MSVGILVSINSLRKFTAHLISKLLANRTDHLSFFSAALQPLSGKVYTYLKLKHVFLFHLFLFELGSLICGVANSSSMLIGGRTLAGLGSAGLMNGGLNIIVNSTPLEKRPLYTGIMIGIGQMGLVTGPLIGGALAEHVTWRWCKWSLSTHPIMSNC
jgi:MFS family permease